MKRISSIIAILGLMVAFATPVLAYQAFKGPLGVLQNNPGSTEGYVLICPYLAHKTYLIDKDGQVIREWESEYEGFYAELLPNGLMARHASLPAAGPVFGGNCGILEEFDWDGNVVWSHQAYEEGKEISHHTFEVMPNGDYLLLVWEKHSYDEALAKGLDPSLPDRALFPDGVRIWSGGIVDGIWPDSIRQINHDHETVWEWKVWDHTGAVDAYHAWNINKYLTADMSVAEAGPDWTHFNGVAYNADTNKITVTSRALAEVYVIDYASGDLLYRWGNPYNWGNGRISEGYADNGDQMLYGPHAPDWTVEGYITVLDNGCLRPNQIGTGFVELDWQTDSVVNQWYASNVGSNRSNFYSSHQCGVNKMPNGNYLLTGTNNGHILEIGADHSIVWEFVAPWTDDVMYSTSSGHGQNGNGVHRAMFYAPDWIGFAGKDLSPQYSLPNWVEDLLVEPVPITRAK